MSGPKTVALPKMTSKPKKKSKRISADEQQRAADAVTCEQIRERAYYKWEAAGCPCCDGVDFWLHAEAELNGQSKSENRASEK